MKKAVILLTVTLLTSSLILTKVFAATTSDYTYDTSTFSGVEFFAGLFSLVSFLSIMGFSTCLYCIPMVFLVALGVLWLIMLIDLIQRRDQDFGEDKNSKLMWMLIVLLTGYIGAAIYYFMIYRKFKKS